MNSIEGICEVAHNQISQKTYTKHLADCVILTHNKRLYLQQRPAGWGKFSGMVNLFGGHVEGEETPLQAIIREIAEETGGIILNQELRLVGKVTEDFTQHTELVHVYFWHDKQQTITGCYEALPLYFETLEAALAQPQLMPYAKWALLKCRQLGFL